MDVAGRDRWFKFFFNILSLVSERCVFRATETDKQTETKKEAQAEIEAEAQIDSTDRYR